MDSILLPPLSYVIANVNVLKSADNVGLIVLVLIMFPPELLKATTVSLLGLKRQLPVVLITKLLVLKSFLAFSLITISPIEIKAGVAPLDAWSTVVLAVIEVIGDMLAIK
ncbi:hypothetical protein JAO76_01980 [Pontibacter sp. BT310]|uniref:Uncharacterized protein n=1 Tax=Pontibacter populi TaxID=890055 RepID=A0ABS6X713_9BACT|nr:MULTISPECIES: hypothetical protein [Pontibacter]MBJ6116941.1 hypothetical protein [Pontibacter sp. BT310]MBR0569365.1 hypothetical protein [Microvirga sp. STS03]MBW3363794.1 hypothetical protein [Pontibacter populi]